jgi:chromate transporter
MRADLPEAQAMSGLSMQWSDWLQLFMQYLSLSLLSVGGAISTAPEMHRYLVDETRWLTDQQFNASIAIAQAAPGPNVLFVALMGWHVGINTGSVAMGLFGVLVTMVGIMLPSTTLTYLAAQWGHRNRKLRGVRAFKQGMAPIVIALLVATGWVLTSAHNDAAKDWRLWLLTAVSALVIWRTRLHLLWMLGAGAVLGWFGFV